MMPIVYCRDAADAALMMILRRRRHFQAEDMLRRRRFQISMVTFSYC